MAVNLAAANIADATLPDAVAALLERHGIPGDRLECEISEHTVMADPRRAMAILERLRALGVRLSLDDFGTGHSSLSYLKRLPLDEVKIDRSFVIGDGRATTTTPRSCARRSTSRATSGSRSSPRASRASRSSTT